MWARSLVDPAVLEHARPGAELVASDDKTFDDVLAIYRRAAAEGLGVARVHSGDPTLYGTLNEQLRACRELGLECEIVPGVSSLGAAAAALGQELTIPDVSQSLILTRRAQRTSMPPNEELTAFAAHGTTMALFLSVRRPRELQADLLAGGYAEDTPCAVVYRASWPDEIVIRCPLGELGERVRAAKITTQALVLSARRWARKRAARTSTTPATATASARSAARTGTARAVARTGAGRTVRRPVAQRLAGASVVSGRIVVLGVSGGRVPPGTEALLERADVVAGGRAVLDALAPAAARRVVLGKGLAATVAALRDEPGRVCVLASGDPGFFGIVRALGDEPLEVHPAPSSVALAFARLGIPWDDALVVSAHARDPRPAIHTALRHPKVAILTDDNAAAIVAALDGRKVTVAEALGTPGERIGSEPPFAPPNVVIVEGEERAPRATRWGLPEDAFEHRAGMITKAEVRAVALAALGPGTGDLVWDVGCGSGSVAIECARLGAAVIAIDDDPDAIALTTRNAADP